jgi:hypothetical protein
MYISFATKIDLATCEQDCQFAADHQIPALDIVLTDVSQLTLTHIKSIRHLLNAYGSTLRNRATVRCKSPNS